LFGEEKRITSFELDTVFRGGAESSKENERQMFGFLAVYVTLSIRYESFLAAWKCLVSKKLQIWSHRFHSGENEAKKMLHTVGLLRNNLARTEGPVTEQ